MQHTILFPNSVEKDAFVCVQWCVRNWLFSINRRTITFKIMVRYKCKKEWRPKMWHLQGWDGQDWWVGLGEGSPWPHSWNIPRLNKKKINKKVNWRNNMQIIYLITLFKYYILQRSKIIYYAARGRNWTFYVKCDVSSTSRVLYTSHETKVQFRPLAANHIFHNSDTWRVHFVSKRGDTEGKALGKKNPF